MKTKVTVLTTLALAHTVVCDFTLAQTGIGGTGIVGNAEGWQVFAPGADAVDSCDNAKDWIWGNFDDVSGDRFGVRCVGDSNSCSRGGAAADGISELELNTRTGPHFTFYKARDGALVDVNDVQIGSCTVSDGLEFNCGLDPVGQAVGQNKLNCISSLTADDINAHRP